MKGYFVYSQIKQLKEKGFKQNAVALLLGVHRETVKRYWNMTADEYEAMCVSRVKLLDEYEDIILLWLEEYPTASASQVCDWLKENYRAEYPERTVSRYVKELRERHGLAKASGEPRSYEAVPELPMGKQLQVDFGEKWMPSVNGGRVKVRFAAFVLANARYKYLEFQSRAFTTVDLVRACHNCFSYLGGIPQELVFDQDSIITVNENYGDVIHTYEFEKLRQECKFSVYLCRKSDPESKGKIENVVRFVKGNFLENRNYMDDDILNKCALEWLERTGNAKVHGTTKRIPAEVWKEEREYLRPLPETVATGREEILRTVRKDNTILYDSNRYSVPLGTYNTQKEVRVEVKGGILQIQTVFGEAICEHMISPGRGMLIKNQNHGRNREEAIDRVLEATAELLGEEATTFLRHIRQDKSRYARDQFALLAVLHGQYGKESTLEAIRSCEQMGLYSATYVKDYLGQRAKPLPQPSGSKLPVSGKKYHVSAEKRSIDAYVKAGEAR